MPEWPEWAEGLAAGEKACLPDTQDCLRCQPDMSGIHLQNLQSLNLSEI